MIATLATNKKSALPPPQKKHNDQKFKHLSKVPVYFFIGEFSQKFDLKNVILTNAKEFSWEKWLFKLAKFRKEKKIQIARFL